MISRRSFTRLAALGAGAAATGVHISVAHNPASTVARLSSNENPHGPSAAALKAVRDHLSLANRYPDAEEDLLTEAIAKLHSVSTDQILLGNGSSELLKVVSDCFSGPDRSVVMAQPTFEVIARHSRDRGTDVMEVPLTADFRHDLAKMQEAKNAGLIYICNPNNPTASITPKEELRMFVYGVPSKTTLVIDEAYHHYVESSRYESLAPLVNRRENLVVLRTFSKIYGMAGLRCGYAIATAELIKRMRRHQSFNNMNVAALVAARASLAEQTRVAQQRTLNSDTRKSVVKQLAELGYRTIPSEANFIMVDMERPVRPLITALRERAVQVGRVFPALPNHLRVTIGTPAEMNMFLTAVQEVVLRRAA